MPQIGAHRMPATPWKGATATGTRSAKVEVGNQRFVVFSGHGSLNTQTDAGNLQFTVPAGMTIYFWVAHGVGLENLKGMMVDKRFGLQDLVKNTGSAVEVLRGGDVCYNYRLTAPTGLTLGNDTSIDPRFITNKYAGDPRAPVSVRGLLFKNLLKTHEQLCANANIHWAACRSIVDR